MRGTCSRSTGQLLQSSALRREAASLLREVTEEAIGNRLYIAVRSGIRQSERGVYTSPENHEGAPDVGPVSLSLGDGPSAPKCLIRGAFPALSDLSVLGDTILIAVDPQEHPVSPLDFDVPLVSMEPDGPVPAPHDSFRALVLFV